MKRIANEVREQIVSMYRNGKIHREIHEETGVSMGMISRICREAGLDKFHVGGIVTKSCPAMNNALPSGSERPSEPVLITSRTLNLHGCVTGCDYVAGTQMQTVDITLDDWAMSIDRNKLSAFIAELEHIRKTIGAR